MQCTDKDPFYTDVIHSMMNAPLENRSISKPTVVALLFGLERLPLPAINKTQPY